MNVRLPSLLVFSILSCFIPLTGQCKDAFPWIMYYPAVTSKCFSGDVTFCTDRNNCEAAGGFWYDDACHSEPGCSPGFTDLCTTEPDCLDAGGYWYAYSCHEELSPNYVQTMRLAGEWSITVYTSGHNLHMFFVMQGDTIEEDPIGSGEFLIQGTDEDRNVVLGAFDSSLNLHTFWVDRGTQDYYFEFNFISSTDVAGCLYLSQHSNNSPSDCFDMVGTKINTR